MAATTTGIVYEEALRAVSRQQAVLDGVRSRAGTLFAAASLVTAFLGGQTLTRHPHIDVFAWIAIGTFVCVFGLTLAVLWPWPFQFVLSSEILIQDHLGKPVEELETYLARIWERNYDRNQLRIDMLFLLFRAASTALSLEVVAWLVSLERG